MSDKSGRKGAGPDVSAIDPGKCTAREFPPGKVDIPEGELRVSIGQRAYDHIQKHAAEESEREICGVMLGDICKDDSGPFLHITEIIRGEHTTSQGAQVTITHETWGHFHNIKDGKFPNKEYLGWYHSHPDFGIFLSSMDLFIHENFFNAPHQVALVADPVRREEGLFFWKRGAPERAAKFWVGRAEHKYEPAPEPSAEQLALRELEKKLERVRLRLRGMDEFARSKSEGGWMQTFLLTGILLLLLVLAGKDWWSAGTRRILNDEDRIRRRFLQVEMQPGSNRVYLKYRFPAPHTPEKRYVDSVTGDLHINVSADLATTLKSLVPVERKSDERKPDEKKKDNGKAGSGKASDGGNSDSGSVPHTSPVDPGSGKPKSTGGTEGKGGQ